MSFVCFKYEYFPLANTKPISNAALNAIQFATTTSIAAGTT